MERRQFVASLVAGGCAGMCVDLTLFPLDTIKTRLQSQQGFHKAGGFGGIYAGVPSAAVGSFPNAAAFFVTYECTKSLLGASGAFAAPRAAPVSHMLAASLGEIVACLIRVPTEVVKQRTQASPSSTTYNMLLATLREEGVRGLYRGYGSTVLREIPFSLVQFPLWEYLKARWQPSSPPLSTWRRPGSCWPRRAQPRRAATSRWCSATCGGAKAFQGDLPFLRDSIQLPLLLLPGTQSSASTQESGLPGGSGRGDLRRRLKNEMHKSFLLQTHSIVLLIKVLEGPSGRVYLSVLMCL
ncbi:S-adenosylmethionine mitochondrial carrier protein isoform X2 [Xiphophorus maculatus]|uniref:S-adenosylmethionine mitochondrial carrier protein isoform X2 n=1 Tax=Xiphophorus maculatus TaxID=8083 RepID=UPI000C6D8E9C|nr:S-adenosylmethionine mitochondrial carrier protein isoform X2 [Xiphophorus maculatus]